MNAAFREAEKAFEQDEVPIGAAVVKNGIIIGRGYNQCESLNDPTAHAEIQVLRIAAKQQSNYRLVGSTIYVTLEPCAMCLGAMMHARIKRIVFGASDPKTGVCGSCANLTSEAFFNHRIEALGGILEKESKEILQSFFKVRRKEKAEKNY